MLMVFGNTSVVRLLPLAASGHSPTPWRKDPGHTTPCQQIEFGIEPWHCNTSAHTMHRSHHHAWPLQQTIHTGSNKAQTASTACAMPRATAAQNGDVQKGNAAVKAHKKHWRMHLAARAQETLPHLNHVLITEGSMHQAEQALAMSRYM
jgi:hypothetical protein